MISSSLWQKSWSADILERSIVRFLKSLTNVVRNVLAPIQLLRQSSGFPADVRSRLRITMQNDKMRSRSGTNTVSRVCQITCATFVGIPITKAFLHSRGPTGDLNAALGFLSVLCWVWLVIAICLFSRRAFAWWGCLVFSTILVFVPFWLLCAILTDAVLGHYWPEIRFDGLAVTLPPILVFGLHLRTRAKYLLPR